MSLRLAATVLLLPLSLGACTKQHLPPPEPAMPAQPIHEVPVTTIDGEETTLSPYRGQVMLIVNTASRCGFTPQYEGLEAVYQRYGDRGFTVLAFPSNDFMGQEPGSNEEIKAFCTTRFKTTFPLFAKVTIGGADQHPLYDLLTSTPGYEGRIGWNFTKFLIDRDGRLIGRWPSKVAPEDPELIAAIERALAPTPEASTR